jgi:hypothetical protein
MEEERNGSEAVDALCRECGHAFKLYVDRVIPAEKQATPERDVACPVCGCGDCRIGR